MASCVQQLQSLAPLFAAARIPAAPRPKPYERVSPHTPGSTHTPTTAPRRPAETRRRRNRPDDAGLSTVQLLHTNARPTPASPRRGCYTQARATANARRRDPPPQTRRRATPRAGATGRPCRRTSPRTRGPIPGHVPQGCGRDRGASPGGPEVRARGGRCSQQAQQRVPGARSRPSSARTARR